jgi:hypothetical protein
MDESDDAVVGGSHAETDAGTVTCPARRSSDREAGRSPAGRCGATIAAASPAASGAGSSSKYTRPATGGSAGAVLGPAPALLCATVSGRRAVSRMTSSMSVAVPEPPAGWRRGCSTPRSSPMSCAQFPGRAGAGDRVLQRDPHHGCIAFLLLSRGGLRPIDYGRIMVPRPHQSGGLLPGFTIKASRHQARLNPGLWPPSGLCALHPPICLLPNEFLSASSHRRPPAHLHGGTSVEALATTTAPPWTWGRGNLRGRGAVITAPFGMMCLVGSGGAKRGAPGKRPPGPAQ